MGFQLAHPTRCRMGFFNATMTKKKKRKPGQKSHRTMTKANISLYSDQLPISAADVREAIDFWKRRDKKLGDLFFH